MRDCRIATLYEGTTGVQALDLLGRKVLATQGVLMRPIVDEILTFCEAHPGRPMAEQVGRKLQDLGDLTREIGGKVDADPDALGCASVDYMMYTGYVLLAWLWARAAFRADEMLASGEGDESFLRAKIQTAEFYFARMLPRTVSLAASMQAETRATMAMSDEGFLSQL
jgi:hypothetical protein